MNGLKGSGVKINDGKFEVLFIKKPKNIIGWINTLISLALKKHTKKYFYYFQTDKIKVNSDSSLVWTLDGEYGGRNKEAEIINNKEAVEYIIPV